MIEITYQMVLSTLQTVGILAGIVYYLTIIRNTSKARERELIYQKFQNISLEYIQTFNEVQLMTDWETPEEWEEKFGRENNLDAFSKWNYVIRHYTLAGVLLKQGADPVRALHLASRSAAADSPHPAYWAPFTIILETEPAN